MENNNIIIADEDKKTFRQILKEQSATIAIGVATLALTAFGAYDNHKRANRKEEAYNSYLDAKIELQREALGSYQDSLDSERPSDNNFKE